MKRNRSAKAAHPGSRSNATARLRIVFFGTSPFALPALDALAAANDVVGVVTHPDRPAGRGLQLRPTPVMQRAKDIGLTTHQPQRIDADFIARIAALRPPLLVCASYGKILPDALLAVPGMTSLNIHPSALPEYRGATPIQSALRDGRDRTGVTVFWMTRDMDAGDLALQREVPIELDDDYGRLHGRLAVIGAELIAEAATLVADGLLPRVPQDHARATYTKPIRKADLRISGDSAAKNVVDLVRSASPSPAAWTEIHGMRVKVLAARAEPPGASTVGDGPLIPATDGVVRLLRVIPEGKREMTGVEFARLLSTRK